MTNSCLITSARCRAALLALLCAASLEAAELSVPVLFLHQPEPRPPLLSKLLSPPEDAGLRGAELGVSDSNTTGRFLGHRYSLAVREVDTGEQAARQARAWLENGNRLIVARLPAASLLLAAKAVGSEALVFNVASTDDALRTARCRSGLLHTIPSRAMLADALTQFLMARRWKRWLLVKGERPRDEAYAQAMKRAARRFGASVVDERSWRFDTDLRRTAQQELPLFTQADNYDVVVVADELGDVGEFLPYNTWLPRPVVGTQGLTPVAWDAVVEQWGGLQLQNRFRKLAGRAMTEQDYAAWAALRSIAEAVTRTGSMDHRTLYAYLHDEAFELAAFKGRKLSYRSWNGQLRQPIPLVQPRAVVSQSPQAGFLHPTTELDTLGYDRPEVQCNYEQTL